MNPHSYSQQTMPPSGNTTGLSVREPGSIPPMGLSSHSGSRLGCGRVAGRRRLRRFLPDIRHFGPKAARSIRARRWEAPPRVPFSLADGMPPGIWGLAPRFGGGGAARGWDRGYRGLSVMAPAVFTFYMRRRLPLLFPPLRSPLVCAGLSRGAAQRGSSSPGSPAAFGGRPAIWRFVVRANIIRHQVDPGLTDGWANGSGRVQARTPNDKMTTANNGSSSLVPQNSNLIQRKCNSGCLLLISLAEGGVT